MPVVPAWRLVHAARQQCYPRRRLAARFDILPAVTYAFELRCVQLVGRRRPRKH